MSLTLKMKVDQSALSVGEMVMESVLVSNFDESIRVLPWNTPLDLNMNGHFLGVFDISEGEAIELPYAGRVVKRLAPQASDYLDLAPSEQLSNRLDITNSYDFCRGRRYIIEFNGAFYAPDGVKYAVSSEPIEVNSSAEFPRCQN